MVRFHTENNLNNLSKEEQKIYDKNHIFLVVTREDYMLDICRCDLIDENGEIHDYCPRIQFLDNMSLESDYKVLSCPITKVETLYNTETRMAIYESAQKYLNELE